ncbi:hypothetical protein NS365_05240 [Aureimonas ureilytica]|uniref:O-antigen ligase-related domain-containing protein n=1 Tax=Aureimonas ureilytica TaxID=401562 RepID=A0A175RTM6_9HYPH|nr:O-antigen ligase family protein [Aureimonas ureilytica]KTR07050.1 hypothetical protein NS365_05240 [Aureimonas ureilytica]
MVNVPYQRTDNSIDRAANAFLDRGLFKLLIVLSIIQFSGAWYWGGFDASSASLEGQQMFGTPFRYLVWGSISLAFAVYLSRYTYRAPLRALMPFLPFLGVGVISGLLGENILIAVRSITFWILMFLSAFASAAMLKPRSIAFIITNTLMVLVLASIAMSILNPTIGVSVYGGETVWVGLFTQKNTFGFLAMCGFLCAYAFHPTIGRLRTALLGIGSAVCLFMSGSMGALMIAFGAISYMALVIAILRARVTTPIASTIIIVSVASLVVFVLTNWTDITQTLGRDPTLTGRTEIWSAYLSEAYKNWFIGLGPGSFSGESRTVMTLFYMLKELGNIRQPHNAYILSFGEGGILGVTAYVSALAYMAFVAPFRHRTPESAVCAMFAFAILVASISEGRGVFIATIEGYLLLLFRTLAVRSTGPNYIHSSRRV